MKLWVLILVLCFSTMGCARTYTYTYYEVIHSVRQLAVGDTVSIETKDGVSFRGTLVRVNDDELVLTTEGEERRRVPWHAIRLIQRIEKASVTSG